MHTSALVSEGRPAPDCLVVGEAGSWLFVEVVDARIAGDVHIALSTVFAEFPAAMQIAVFAVHDLVAEQLPRERAGRVRELGRILLRVVVAVVRCH